MGVYHNVTVFDGFGSDRVRGCHIYTILIISICISYVNAQVAGGVLGKGWSRRGMVRGWLWG